MEIERISWKMASMWLRRSSQSPQSKRGTSEVKPKTTTMIGRLWRVCVCVCVERIDLKKINDLPKTFTWDFSRGSIFRIAPINKIKWAGAKLLTNILISLIFHEEREKSKSSRKRNMCTHFCEGKNNGNEGTYLSHTRRAFVRSIFFCSLLLSVFVFHCLSHSNAQSGATEMRRTTYWEYSIPCVFIENMFPSIFRTLHFIL